MSGACRITFNFPGNVILRDPAVSVDVSHLRNAFLWYLGHNWQWIDATKTHDIATLLDRLVNAYRSSMGGADRGVPGTLLRTATPVDAEDVAVHLPGPADAARAASSDSDGELPTAGREARCRTKADAPARRTISVDSSAAIIGSGVDDVGPAQLLHVAMEKYGILQQCGAEYDRAMKSDDSDALKRIACEEAEAVAAAVHAIQKLSASEARKKLEEYHDFVEDKPRTVRIGHARQPLCTFSDDWWVCAMTDLFYTGDFYKQRGISLRKWAKTLLQRADYSGWALSKEFAAAARNICIRRDQMWAVHRYVSSSAHFARVSSDLLALRPADFVSSALAAGDCHSIRHALRKKGVLDKVKESLRCIDFALRGVEGSESERELFRLKFGAMRIWNGCSFIFFTLNPHDIKTPLLLAFLSERHTQIERVSLDWSDLDLTAYYGRLQKGNRLILHELASKWPAAAAACVHWAFDKTIQIFFQVCASSELETEAATYPYDACALWYAGLAWLLCWIARYNRTPDASD